MMKTSIGKNILANFIGKVWTVLISLAFVPVFVKIMGEEAYGIVTFFAVMQSVLNIMGVGLQRTLRREFAKVDENYNRINLFKYKMLRSSEFVYFIVCVIIFCLCFFESNFIANKWLNYNTLEPSLIASVIILMGLSIGLQLVANLYAGGIFGLDMQGLGNGLQIGWMTLKNVGVIPMIYFTEGSILYFYIWMLFMDLLYCIVLRTILIKKIPTLDKKTWSIKDISILREIWKYAGGLFLISIGTAFSTQLDKIIMSKNLSVIECGAYNSAFQLGSFAAYIPTIIGTAIFSNITTLIFQNKKNEAEALFKPMNKLAIIVVSTMSSYISLFSFELILVWTGSEIYADIMKQAAPLVILGYMLNAFQQVPYDYLLAQGNTKLNQGLLVVSIPYVCTVTVLLTKKYGVMGASVAWFIQLLILTTVYLLFFYRISFKKDGVIWLLKDNYGVFLVAFIPASLVRFIINKIQLRPVIIVVVAIICGALTLLSLLFILERGFIKNILLKCKVYR